MSSDTPEQTLPQHVAIIMDGNGRWAEKHNIARSKGHEEGGRTVQRVIDACLERGIRWLTVYAFSTENWGRSKLEVAYLMRMLERYLREHLPEMMEKGVRMHAIGELHMLPKGCQRQIERCKEATKDNTKLNFVLAISYGSRQEIAAAVRSIATQVQRGEIKPEDITPETVAANLYTAGMPDPDLLIRTSGELRISNYLLWQISYAEIWVTDVLWPDFSAADLDEALESYASRNRRFGKR